MKSFLLYLSLGVLALGSALPDPASNAQVAANARKHLVFDCSDRQAGGMSTTFLTAYEDRELRVTVCRYVSKYVFRYAPSPLFCYREAE